MATRNDDVQKLHARALVHGYIERHNHSMLNPLKKVSRLCLLAEVASETFESIDLRFCCVRRNGAERLTAVISKDVTFDIASCSPFAYARHCDLSTPAGRDYAVWIAAVCSVASFVRGIDVPITDAMGRDLRRQVAIKVRIRRLRPEASDYLLGVSVQGGGEGGRMPLSEVITNRGVIQKEDMTYQKRWEAIDNPDTDNKVEWPPEIATKLDAAVQNRYHQARTAQTPWLDVDTFDKFLKEYQCPREDLVANALLYEFPLAMFVCDVRQYIAYAETRDRDHTIHWCKSKDGRIFDATDEISPSVYTLVCIAGHADSVLDWYLAPRGDRVVKVRQRAQADDGNGGGGGGDDGAGNHQVQDPDMQLNKTKQAFRLVMMGIRQEKKAKSAPKAIMSNQSLSGLPAVVNGVDDVDALAESFDRKLFVTSVNGRDKDGDAEMPDADGSEPIPNNNDVNDVRRRFNIVDTDEQPYNWKGALPAGIVSEEKDDE
jgi:hypothetical protein